MQTDNQRKKVFRLHLLSNSQLMADKLGHICGSCVSAKTKEGGRCCRGCAGANGHFLHSWKNDKRQVIEISPEKLDELKQKYGFEDDVGFKYGKGFLTEKGCSLPREERSQTCLKYFCHDWAEGADETTKEQLHRLSDRQYRTNLGFNYDEEGYLK